MKLLRILFLVPILFLVSCTALKPGCFIQDKLADVATTVIVSKLQCVGVAAVKADMDALAKNLGLCKVGPIADVVCPSLVDAVVDKVVHAAIPSTWGCSAEDAKGLVKEALLAACKQIPVSEWKSK